MVTITVLRAGESYDPFSRTTTAGDWDNPTTHTFEAFAIAPGAVSERSDITVPDETVLATVFAPADVDVVSTDRLQIGGDMFAVIGQPARWDSPWSTWRPGTVIEIGELRHGT